MFSDVPCLVSIQFLDENISKGEKRKPLIWTHPKVMKQDISISSLFEKDDLWGGLIFHVW